MLNEIVRKNEFGKVLKFCKTLQKRIGDPIVSKTARNMCVYKSNFTTLIMEING